MDGPLLTDAQLRTLSRPPGQAVADAVRAGDRIGAFRLAGEIEAGCRDQGARVARRIQAVERFVGRRFGPRAGGSLAEAMHQFRLVGARLAPSGGPAPALADVVAEAGDDPEAPLGRFDTPLGQFDTALGQFDTALGQFDTALGRWRALADHRRDLLSALFSHVYSEHGVDALEAVHRFTGEPALAGLHQDLRRGPVARLTSLVTLLHGLFSTLEVREDRDRFVVTQSPCGTCSRQVLDGRYQDPWNLAVVREPHLVTWGRGTTTVYRTHVPVWHVAMARERIGVPWPVNQCPHGVSGAACRILVFKDPLDPAANDLVPGPGI